MHGGRGKGRKTARIEIIPLIDIVFFLLATFIMVSLGMTQNRGAEVALPGSETGESLGSEAELATAATLSVTGRGELFFNKEPVSEAELPARLEAYRAETSDPRVIIQSDGSAEFKHIVQVLDEVRKLGIVKVGISTDKD